MHAPAAAPSRDEMIERILANGQFVAGKRAQVFRNGLSTALMVFPPDLLPENREALDRKIKKATVYAAQFQDIAQLNALLYVPGYYTNEKQIERWNLTLGLYLYFSDECSRTKSNVTFLTALRDSGLQAGQGFTSNELYSKVLGAMHVAGIDSEENKKILEDWHDTGHYNIQGNLHYRDGYGMHGAYAVLAEALMKPYRNQLESGQVMGINRAISYVLGHKEAELEEKSAQQIYDEVTRTARSEQLIEKYVADGHDIRDTRMREILSKYFPADYEAEEIRATQKAWEPMKRDVLSYYPAAALQLLLLTDETIAYSDSYNISAVYPEGYIPGVSIQDTQVNGPNNSLTSTAMRFARYPVALFSNGNHPDGAPRELKNLRLAQSSLHELTHVAYDGMIPAEKELLQACAARMETVPLPQIGMLKTLGWNTLAQVLKGSSEMYHGYTAIGDASSTSQRTQALRQEEVICNLYGLMHSEFADRGDPANPIYNGQCPELTQFAYALDDAFNQSVARTALDAQSRKKQATGAQRA